MGAEFLLWCVLGAPLILGNDVRTMLPEYVDLVTNEEALSVAQDPDCIQGSLARAVDASEVWIKPLTDGSFAAVLLNKAHVPMNVTLHIADTYKWGDFYPATIQRIKARDVVLGRDLGEFS